MNWSRVSGVVIGFVIWATIDALTGKANSVGLALLAGFVTAWCCEKPGK